MKLRPDIEAALTFQAYPPAPTIAGVTLTSLSKLRSDNGAFMEVLRLQGGQANGFTLRQLSVSWATPGRINAFHLHPRRQQNELWCVLAGQLLVWLVDVRADSATSGVRRSLLLSGEAPALLQIPAGVAHGYKAGAHGGTLLYGVDDPFDPADPNEGRLPWDFFGADLWEEDRG